MFASQGGSSQSSQSPVASEDTEDESPFWVPRKKVQIRPPTPRLPRKQEDNSRKGTEQSCSTDFPYFEEKPRSSLVEPECSAPAASETSTVAEPEHPSCAERESPFEQCLDRLDPALPTEPDCPAAPAQCPDPEAAQDKSEDFKVTAGSPDQDDVTDEEENLCLRLSSTESEESVDLASSSKSGHTETAEAAPDSEGTHIDDVFSETTSGNRDFSASGGVLDDAGEHGRERDCSSAASDTSTDSEENEVNG